MNIKTRGLIYLWVSILLFASLDSIIGKLGQLGVNYPIHGHNPISFCNVLFAGNIIAGIVFIIGYRKQLSVDSIWAIQAKEWGSLSLVTIFATILGPIFYLLAILTTAVINVVLISTTEIVWALVLGYLFLNEKPSRLTLLGVLIAAMGVSLTFYLNLPDSMPMAMKMAKANVGEGWLGHLVATAPKIGLIFALLGALFTIMGDILTNRYISNIPKPIYSIFRTCVGALFFFVVATYLFGLTHFADLFSPFLWEWMLFYGGVIFAMAIFTFSQAIEHVNPQSIAIGNAFYPIAGVIFAYLIVGEIPNSAQIIGGVVILVGIAVGLYDNIKAANLEEERLIGFKGI
ncbi:DMT family transporter [Legionella sp. W05-934-2]|jgi:drug/metabolite transporter (DMT)-like permease|uniref:DMT family transporter n=1 Tax=Legionella sp. W05-934-2 TaxID=1198649 RepID=UPI003462DD8C